MTSNFYYPLGLRSKVNHALYGFIPSKKYIAYKRKFFSKFNLGLQPCNKLVHIFAEIYQRLRNSTVESYHKLLKKPELPNILNIFNTLIPDNYFGSRNNKKKVFFIINRILTQTRGEFIHVCTLYEGYEYDKFLWLNVDDPNFSIKEQIFLSNLLLLQTVVKPLIRYFYFYVNKFHNREFLVFPNGQLHSFIDKNISRYLKLGYIKKIEKESSKKLRLNGTLMFIPKKSLECLDCRPILLNSRNKHPLSKLKENLHLLIKKYDIGDKSLYEKWRRFTEYNRNRRQLYSLKLDLKDAFGMVDLQLLENIINQDNEFLTEPQKNYVYKFMSNQFVNIRGSRQYYQWCHGLLQGATLSPILCDLYLSYEVFQHLRQFYKPNTLIHRTVDDIIFVSTCDSDVYEFELTAMRIFLLNEGKSQTFVSSEDDPHIVYCGKIFNMETREISNSYAFEKDTQMRTKFKLWNPNYQFSPDKKLDFMINAMKFEYVNYCFTRYELNTTCNSVDTVLKNIFDGMCFVAFKLDCVVESIEYLFHNMEDRCTNVYKVIRLILTTYSLKIRKIIERYKGEKHKSIFTFRVLKFLVYKAFTVVFKKRFLKYKYVIDKLAACKHRVVLNNFKYFYKLPEAFKMIKMHRRQNCIQNY